MYGRLIARRKNGWKFELSAENKGKRLGFAKKYRDFDWKRAIFTEEAIVRGGEVRDRLRTWRLEEEAYHKDVVIGKHDGYSMGMIWGCFGYSRKGPLQFYREATREEAKRLQHLIDLENAETRPRLTVMYVAGEALKNNPDNGTRKEGRPAKLDNFCNQWLKTRIDRSNVEVDWLRHREGTLEKLIY